MQNQKKVQTCVEALRHKLPREFAPAVGVVLGTGLGNLVDELRDPVAVPYAELPSFPQSTTVSHRGNFVAGRLCGVPVLLQQGRCHLYEGHSPADVVMGVRVMALLGIHTLIITNAAGAVNPQFAAGSLMVIEDQINRTGRSPLTGDNVEAWGLRFPDVAELYDPALLDIAAKTALGLGIRLEKGVYLCTHGPELETRAETRAYRLMGADAVGMSTALEAIAAHHMGVRVLGISCLSNKNLPDCMAKATIEDIVETARVAGADLTRLVAGVLPQLAGAAGQGGDRPFHNA